MRRFNNISKRLGLSLGLCVALSTVSIPSARAGWLQDAGGAVSRGYKSGRDEVKRQTSAARESARKQTNAAKKTLSSAGRALGNHVPVKRLPGPVTTGSRPILNNPITRSINTGAPQQLVNRARQLGGTASQTGKQAAGEVAQRTQRLVNGSVAQGKQLGGQFSRSSKHLGGQAAHEWKRRGGQLAQGTKDALRNAARTTTNESKNLGRELAGGLRRVQRSATGASPVFRDPRGAMSRAVDHVAGDISRESAALGGEISDASKRVRTEVGRPWVRAVRDPWVRWLERGYNTGADRTATARERYDEWGYDTASRIPTLATGDDFEANVEGGSANPSPVGEHVTRVDAPQGGTAGIPIDEVYEGRDVRITMWAIVNRGSARAGLGADTGELVDVSTDAGTVMASSREALQNAGLTDAQIDAIQAANGGRMPEVRQLTFETHIPSDGQGDHGMNSMHNYEALMQFDPGTNVDILGCVVQRVN